MSKTRKIVSATIGPMPVKLGDPMPLVVVKTDDGHEFELFNFYPDEISFKESELVGLTLEEAVELRHKKDAEFLRS